MWNPESTGMESGIHSVESGIQDSLGLPYMGQKTSSSTLSLTETKAYNMLLFGTIINLVLRLKFSSLR